jgi:hypothetical protein
MSLDRSIIDLSVSLFDRAKYRRTKGAIKLHVLLNHDGCLPSFEVVTAGKTSEINSSTHWHLRLPTRAKLRISLRDMETGRYHGRALVPRPGTTRQNSRFSG